MSADLRTGERIVATVSRQSDSPLPSSWLATTLGAVVPYGQTEKAEPTEIGLDDWILELEDIEKDTSRLLVRVTMRQRNSKSTKNRFQAGDVLYGKLRPYLNKVLIADRSGYCTTEIVPIQSGGAVDNRYLFYWLKHPSFLKYVEAESHGMNMPRLGTEAGRSAPMILAPLPEQKRIADKLDRLLARVDACRERLDRVPALLKRFRQSVLAAATSGELTREWRGGIDANWDFERAEAVCAKVQSGGTPKAGFVDEGIPFLKVYNLVNQQIDFQYKPQFVSPEVHRIELRKSETRPGDVLMNIVGPPLGKVAIVPASHEVWNINQAITLFRPSERICSQWIYHLLCSGQNIASIQNETRGSAGQVNISLSQCRDFVFPVPPMPEQIEIVRRLDEMFAFLDSLEAKAIAALHLTQNAVPALLAKAFRGELVPQDPTDEPAYALLTKLKTEQARSAAAPSRRPKTPEKRPSMRNTDKDSIKTAILKQNVDSFSFDELRAQVPSDYESLKAAVFELLEEPSPVIRQVFDQATKTMQLVRVRK